MIYTHLLYVEQYCTWNPKIDQNNGEERLSSQTYLSPFKYLYLYTNIYIYLYIQLCVCEKA